MNIVQNLNQLKKVLTVGVEFEILLHTRAECVGQVRRVTKANTAGFYTTIPAESDNCMSTGNNGQGSFLEWGPARFWTFDSEGICAQYSNYQDRPNEILIAFKILEASA